MHNPESVLENEMYKILWDFEIQTNHLTTARRTDLLLINKKKELVILWILLFRSTIERKDRQIPIYYQGAL